MSRIFLPLASGVALFLVSCSTTSSIRPDANRDGQVSVDENVQYTRKLQVAQNRKQAGFKDNVADVDEDGRITDLEWQQYTTRQEILGGGSGYAGTESGGVIQKSQKVLDNTHKALNTFQMLRILGGIF